MIHPWIKALRLRTLPLAWAALTMGGSLASMEGYFDWGIYVLSLLTAFGLQIASNLANDYGDAATGLDGEHRQGPSRTIQSGLISKQQMKRAIILASIVSFVFGLTLIYYAFIDWVLMLAFVGVGLASIAAALKYTMGKNPYGYAGWGDLFVLVFFGWIGVGGSYFLYTQVWNPIVLLPASAVGLLAVAVLNVNNIRDIESDELSGKYSIPVRIGRFNAVIYHGVILTLAFGAMIFFGWKTFEGWQWLFLIIAPLMIINWLAVRREKEPMKLDPYLRQMALTVMLLVVLFVLGNLINGFA